MAGLNVYPGQLDNSTNNSNIRDNIKDFEDRAIGDATNLYSVLADDIIVLQDIVLAIETELGTNPSSTDATVADRIATIITTATADSRYASLYSLLYKP